MRRDQGQQGRLFGAGEGEGPVQSAGALPTLPTAGGTSRAPGEPVQPEGELTFDGHTYFYRGYVLEAGAYVRKTCSFTCDELDIYPGEPLRCVCAMVDCVGRDAGRQAEIRRFGKRVWHSPYRPEGAAGQGLDYIFRHDVSLVVACHPYVTGLYAAEPDRADRWTVAMYTAYRAYALYRESEDVVCLLQDAGIPPDTCVGGDGV